MNGTVLKVRGGLPWRPEILWNQALDTQQAVLRGLPRTRLHLGQRREVAREAPAGMKGTCALASLLPFPSLEQMVPDEWASTPQPPPLKFNSS